MKTRLTISLFLLLIAAPILVTAARAADSWNPKKTWVFFVCLVKWKDKDQFEWFPEENRKDKVFLDSLKKRGVPDSQIVYMKDQEATTAKVESAFPAFLNRAAAGDTVIVYFEGHGYKDDEGTPFLATYDVDDETDGWRFDAVPNAIEKNFKGSQAIIALDNCYSGAMATSVKRAKRRVSYGVFASSLASQTSTGNWTFTEALISAFNGEPFVDQNRDGQITYAEMGKNACDDMLFGEEQMATVEFTGAFDPQTVIAKSSPGLEPRIGERVEAYSVDGWYRGFIIGARDNKFKVHYYGYESTDDEWVPTKMIRQPKVVQYSVGEPVDVEWEDKWYPAKILDVKGGSHYITYIGYGKEWDEWVTSKRIRKK